MAATVDNLSSLLSDILQAILAKNKVDSADAADRNAETQNWLDTVLTASMEGGKLKFSRTVGGKVLPTVTAADPLAGMSGKPIPKATATHVPYDAPAMDVGDRISAAAGMFGKVLGGVNRAISGGAPGVIDYLKQDTKVVGTGANALSDAGIGTVGSFVEASFDRIIMMCQGFFASVKGMASEGFAAIKAERVGHVVEHTAGAGAEFGKGVEAIPGMEVPGLGIEYGFKFVGFLGESVEKLRDWNEQMHSANIHIGSFNGMIVSSQMAGVNARQDFRDIQLAIERGDRRAESAERLAEAKAGLNRELAPIEDAWANWKDDREAEGTKWLEKMAEYLREMLGLQKGEESKTVDKWLEGGKMLNTNWADLGAPPRHRENNVPQP